MSESSTIIQARRGLKAQLPTDAAQGEFLFCTDTHQLYFGMGTGQPLVEVEADAVSIQTIPVDATPPTDGQVLIYKQANGKYVAGIPAGAGNATSIQGTPVDATPPTDGEILIFDQTSGKYLAADPVVSGPDAPNATPTKPPVQIGAIGADGTVKRATSTNAGELSIAAAALPLPAGAATEAGLGTDGATPPATTGTGIRGWLRAIYEKLVAGLTVSGNVNVGNFPATQPVSGSVAVTNLPATQPVSGTVSVSNFPATQPVSAAALPLPAGAATSANQTNGTQKSQSVDGTGTLFGTAGNPLSVNVLSGGGSNPSVGATGATAPTSATEIGTIDGTGKLQGASATNPVPDNVLQWGGQAVSLPSGGGAIKTAPGVLTGSFTVQNAAGTPAGTTFALITNDPSYSTIVLITDAGAAGNAGGSSLYLECAENASAYGSWVAPHWSYLGQLPGGAAQNFVPATAPWGVASNANSFFQIAFGISGYAYVRARIISPLAGGTCVVRWVAFAEGQVPPVLSPALTNTTSGSVPDNTGNTYPINTLPTGTTNGILPAGIFVNTTNQGNTWSFLRTPNVFKTVSATAIGNTALWTPAGGKKFRLMRYIIEVTSNANLAAGAVETISMQDGTTDIAQTHSVFIPSTAVTTGGSPLLTTGWIDLGNGILSALANNVLNLNLGTALAGGVVRVTCCGTEE